MGLLTLLHKSANADINLIASEIRLLSVLITYVNKDKAGYEAWPSTEILTNKSGLSERTLERAKKSLVKGEWITIQSGKREGKANHYFINAEKIVSAYNKSNPKHTAMPEALSRPSEPHVKRADNSANLVQNKVVDTGYNKQYLGVWYSSEGDYIKAKETEVERKRIEDLNQSDDSPF